MENHLIKIAKVETNPITGDRTYNPVMLPEQDEIVYSEFLKIINQKNQLGQFTKDEFLNENVFGRSNSELKVGFSFSIYSSPVYQFATSTVMEIITPNLFT